MALFPKVEFDILVPHGAIVPGRRTDAILVVTAPEDVPRAERISVAFRSTMARAKGGRVPFFETWIDVPLPGHLAAGTQRFPMVFELPAWLPPGLTAQDLVVAHELEISLDVHFAVAPHRAMVAFVEMAPQVGQRSPLVVRSPRDFHPNIGFEVALASSVIVHGEPLLGSLRLATGLEREFEGIELSLVSVYAQAFVRTSYDYKVFVPLSELAEGKPRTFEVPASPFAPPSFVNHLLRHDLALSVVMVRGWQQRSHFEVPFLVLPRGSAIDDGPLDHLRRWGMAVAAATHFIPGTGMLVAYGDVGAIRVLLRESPLVVRTGIDVIFEYPDWEKDPEAVRFEHIPMNPYEDASRVVEAARAAIARAKSLLAEIATQPFPEQLPGTAAVRWREVAQAHGAFFVQAQPAIHGIVFPFTVFDTERVVTAALRTTWVRGAPQLELTLDLRHMPLPESVLAPLQNGHYPPALAGTQREFPALRVSPNGDTLTLEQAAWPRDPASIVRLIEPVIDWALATRNERRSIAAYR